MMSLFLNISSIFFSAGTAQIDSLSLLRLIHMLSGIPLASMNNPICTIGFGLCSLDTPYLRRPLINSQVTSSNTSSVSFFEVEVRVIEVTFVRISFDYRITGFKEMGEITIIVLVENIHEPKYILMREIKITIEFMKMAPCMKLTTGIQDPGENKGRIGQIKIELNFPTFTYRMEIIVQSQSGMDFLKIKVTDIIITCEVRYDITWVNQFFIKVQGNVVFNSTVLYFFVLFLDFLFIVLKRIIRDLEKFRVFTDPFDILGRYFLTVTDTDLNKVGRVFRFTIIIQFHMYNYKDVIAQDTMT